MNVSIIGSGNLAWHLAVELESAGCNIAEVYSRTAKNAAILTEYLYQTEPVNTLDFRNSSANIFLIAVSDDAILEIASQILLPSGSVLAHTSGSKELSYLEAAAGRNNCYVGVFYPLMTFTKGKRLDMTKVPIFIESSSEEAQTKLSQLANLISDNVYEISGKERLCLHISAVFACNFPNHLWALAKEIADDEGLDFNLMKPLIRETFLKAMQAPHPADVQTGPALRNDISTIKNHEQYLADDEDLLKVYNAMSNSIQDWHPGTENTND